MKILISGASGLVGSAAAAALRAQGHSILRMVRRSASADDEISWDPGGGLQQTDKLEGLDAVVHLAGENVASGRWTAERKRRIRDSRVLGSRNLRDALGAADCRPRVVVAASAIGIYGDRGSEVMTESSSAGDDFLADTCAAWESETAAFSELGARVVQLRIGVVLSTEGGALSRMLTPFRLGLGGRLGNGRQFFSWIARDDLTAIVVRAVGDEAMSGAYNAVAPNPVSNAEFTAALGRVLGRPTLFPMPAPVIKLLFGEMGEALLLSSTRVEPARLREAGFDFAHPEVEAALRHILGR